jgi:N-ethylmaleimide reductase
VIDAVISEAGAGRTGIRLSPVTPLGDPSDIDPQAVFGHLIEELNKRGIAFAHFIEGSVCGARDVPGFSYAWARKNFRGAYIANNGYTREMAIDAVEQDHADAVSFGRAFLANPDLVERLKTGEPLQAPEPSLFASVGPWGASAQAESARSLPAM